MFASPQDNLANLEIPDEIEDKEAAEALLRIFLNWTRGSPNHKSREAKQTQCKLELDSRMFIKLLKQAHLIPTAFSQKDADLAFTIAKQKSTKLTFPMFLFSIFVLAEKHGCEVRDYLGNLVTYSGEGPAYNNLSDESKRGTNPLKGPSRFFYDKSTFTGAHKEGGPSTRDAAEGYRGSFSSLISRDHVQNDSVQRRKFGSKVEKPGSNKMGAVGGAKVGGVQDGNNNTIPGSFSRQELKAKTAEREYFKDNLSKTFGSANVSRGGPGVIGGAPKNFDVKFAPRSTKKRSQQGLKKSAVVTN